MTTFNNLAVAGRGDVGKKLIQHPISYKIVRIVLLPLVVLVGLIMFGCGEASSDGSANTTQTTTLKNKPVALSLSLNAKQGSYMEHQVISEEEYQRSKNKRSQDGVEPFGENDSPAQEPLDTLLKYATSPSSQTHDYDIKIYEDGSADMTITIKNHLPPPISSKVPVDPNLMEASKFEMVDGTQTIRDEKGQILSQETFDLPSFKEVVDSMKANLANDKSASLPPSASASKQLLSLFGFAPSTTGGVRMLSQAREAGATIEQQSDGLVKIVYDNLDKMMLGMGGATTFFSKQPSTLSLMSASMPKMKMTMLYDPKRDRTLSSQMEQNGKLVTKTYIKYRSDQTATKGLKLYGVSTSDVESFPEALLTQTSVPIDPNGKNATFTHYTEYQSITFKNHLTQGGAK